MLTCHAAVGVDGDDAGIMTLVTDLDGFFQFDVCCGIVHRLMFLF